MLLAVDIGNTQTVFGMFEDPSETTPGPSDERSSAGPSRPTPRPGTAPVRGPAPSTHPGDEPERPEIAFHWRVATVTERTADELALLVSELLGLEGLEADDDVGGIVVSSTVPRLTASMREMCAKWFDVPTVILEPGVRTGIPILYDDPREVGADRIANAVGAFAAYGGPSIVVDFGTATTFDCISTSGEYLGGAIVPGVAISMDALFEQAAALRRVELVEPRRVIGKNTVESIQSGAVHGFVAQVEGLCRKLEDEMGESTIVLTGGLADVLAPHLSIPHRQDPWLTLHGLHLIFQRNTAG